MVHDIRSIDPLDLARFGGKAAGLAGCPRLGLPVPPAFVIDTAACRRYRELRELPADLLSEVDAAIADLQQRTGKSFGADRAGGIPLLVSVRSGARISMPGMMDTVLDLELDQTSVLALATGQRRPSRSRWTPGLASGRCMPTSCWTSIPDGSRSRLRCSVSRQLGRSTCRPRTSRPPFCRRCTTKAGRRQTDPRRQLTSAICAVFESWDSRRARLYREHHGISHELGTAVTVQAMVFGNLGAPAGSGVAFTRDPKTGARELFGEYLAGGQGEEVVAGTRTPARLDSPTAEWLPMVAELSSFGDRLEAEYRDALDIEFTAEAGTLYLLQVRPAKRTA